MRLFTLLIAALLSPAAAAQDAAKPLTSAEAAKKVDEKVVVQFEVKSTGGNNNIYLNSLADFREASNFFVFIPVGALEKFKQAGVENPREYYKDKTIHVTGTVTLYEDKAGKKSPQLRVTDPAQIKVITKETAKP